jgi:hypothetical protein
LALTTWDTVLRVALNFKFGQVSWLSTELFADVTYSTQGVSRPSRFL